MPGRLRPVRPVSNGPARLTGYPSVQTVVDAAEDYAEAYAHHHTAYDNPDLSTRHHHADLRREASEGRTLRLSAAGALAEAEIVAAGRAARGTVPTWSRRRARLPALVRLR